MRDQIKQELLAVVAYDEASPSCLVWTSPISSKIKAGQPAGTRTETGYWRVTYRGRKFKAHQLVWELHGNTPTALLDHRDNDGCNNRIDNLRPATVSENGHNRGRSCLSTSGIKSVFWNRTGGWMGQLTHQGKRYSKCFGEDKAAAAAWVADTRRVLAGGFAREN